MLSPALSFTAASSLTLVITLYNHKSETLVTSSQTIEDETLSLVPSIAAFMPYKLFSCLLGEDK